MRMVPINLIHVVARTVFSLVDGPTITQWQIDRAREILECYRIRCMVAARSARRTGSDPTRWSEIETTPRPCRRRRRC